MKQYIEFVADRLLMELGFSKVRDGTAETLACWSSPGKLSAQSAFLVYLRAGRF